MGKGMCGVDHPPAHRRRAGPVLGHEVARVAAGRVGQDIGDVALLPQLHRAVAVASGQREPHAGEQRAQLIRFRMGEFDEGKAIGSGRVAVR